MSNPHLINLSFVKTEIGDDHSVIHDMLSAFQEVFKEFEEKTDLALADGDLGTTSLYAHKIKPSLKMFGLNNMLTQVQQLEKLAKNDQLEEARELREELRYHCTIVNENVANLLNQE